MYRISGTKLKTHLLTIRPNKCEICGIEEWNGQPITLQVHHIDGDNTNNLLNNLQLICPNCHSQTDTYCITLAKRPITDKEFINTLQNSATIHEALIKLNLSSCGTQYKRARKLIVQNKIEHLYQKPVAINYCIDCGKPITIQATRCVSCSQSNLNKTTNRFHATKPITKEELKRLIRIESFTTIGKLYGISDNAIRKWCKKFNLPYRKQDIKQYSDIDWSLL